MEVLITDDYGFGWGSQFGMKFAIDKDLIKFRKKYTRETWREIANHAYTIADNYNLIGNISKEILEEIARKKELKEVAELLKTIYKIDKYIPFLGGLENLEVREVPKGTIFTIDEYDGKETIKSFYDPDFEWTIARE